VSVAQFINTHHLYNSIGQSAIWALTNHHNLAGIFSYSDTGNSKKLIALIACRTGVQMPQYAIVYKPARKGDAFNPEIENYVVEVNLPANAPRNTHVLVFDSTGKVVREEKTEIISAKGRKTFVKFDPETTPHGSYTVALKDDDNTIYQINEVDVE